MAKVIQCCSFTPYLISACLANPSKEAGAKKVFFASAAPRIRHPHIYGIDLALPSELIAHDRTADEIATHIGASKVIFQGT